MSHHRFSCSGCGAVIVVDDVVRAGIIDDGCPICLAPASPSNFALAPDPE